MQEIITIRFKNKHREEISRKYLNFGIDTIKGPIPHKQEIDWCECMVKNEQIATELETVYHAERVNPAP